MQDYPTSVTMPLSTTDGKTVAIDSLVVYVGSKNLAAGHVFDIVSYDDKVIKILHLGKVTEVDAQTLTFIDDRHIVHLRLQVTVDSIDDITVEDCGFVVMGDRRLWSEIRNREIHAHDVALTIKGLRQLFNWHGSILYQGGANPSKTDWMIENVSGHIPWVNFKNQTNEKLLDAILSRYDFEAQQLSEEARADLLSSIGMSERKQKPSRYAVERAAYDLDVQRKFSDMASREIQIALHIAINDYDMPA